MTPSDLEILHAALSGEHFGISAYDAALSLGVLSEGATALARVFQDHHRYHAKTVAEHIKAAGGHPAASKSWNEYAEQHPPPALETEQDVLRYAITLEHGAAAADARAVGELESAELRVLFARIGAVEAMHLAILRHSVGEPPVPDPLLSETSD